MDWTHEVVDQIDWHWRNQLRPRLDGLSDDEYFWEPVAGCWSVRRRGTGTAPVQAGSGEFTIDFAMPTPEPPPVTTIAWRLSHILVGVLGARIASHFGGEPHDYMTYDYPGTAAEALRRLDVLYGQWLGGVRGWDSEAMAEPLRQGEAEQYLGMPRATLVLHIDRELIHHGAEVALLRDLYAHREVGP